jgi:LAO/AO transport system kinase
MATKSVIGRRLSIQQYEEGISAGNRTVLGQAITLIESTLPDDRAMAESLIEKLLPKTGKSIRIGITGVPGVGKSTFIETFGEYLTSINKKLAVLAIDPSSQKNKGSILGDKTRMESLSKNPNAFIRPTATGSSLGGVAGNTREAILLCEAAGYDVILVETVGVGQSEVAVRSMVDFFLLLMLAGAGDDLQGIKKGIMEMADGIVITKADGDNLKKATLAKADLQYALHLFQIPGSGWTVKIELTSALHNTGIRETWETIDSFANFTRSSGYFTLNRQHQQLAWLQESFDQLLKQNLLRSKKLNSTLASLQKKVTTNQISPTKAARELLNEVYTAQNNKS